MCLPAYIITPKLQSRVRTQFCAHANIHIQLQVNREIMRISQFLFWFSIFNLVLSITACNEYYLSNSESLCLSNIIIPPLPPYVYPSLDPPLPLFLPFYSPPPSPCIFLALVSYLIFFNLHLSFHFFIFLKIYRVHAYEVKCHYVQFFNAIFFKHLKTSKSNFRKYWIFTKSVWKLCKLFTMR